jgi:hypothetical protein
VAEAEGEADAVRALRLGAVADADDVELLAEAVGDTDDHVVDEAAGQAVEGAVVALVVGPGDQQLVVDLLDADRGRDRPGELTLGTLHLDHAAFDRDVDPGGDRDGRLSDP